MGLRKYVHIVYGSVCFDWVHGVGDRSLTCLVVQYCYVLLLKKTRLDCAVLNHSHIVATKQAGSFYVDAQTSHHVSYCNGFFDTGLHGAELGTVGRRLDGSLSLREIKRRRPTEESDQARD